MKGTVAVAGASGSLGRHLVPLLVARGIRVRALGRNTGTLAASLPAGVDVRSCDVLGASFASSLKDGLLTDVDVLFSALGANTLPTLAGGRRSFDAVDVPAHRRLIDAARAAKVRRFVYVSCAHDEHTRDLAYVRAHEEVVDLLRVSGLEWGVLRPTGFFSSFATFLTMASRGPLPEIGDGSARTNPIDDLDLAELCAQSILGEGPQEWTVGGPEVLTRRRIGELAFAALERPARFRRAPAGLVDLLGRVVRPFHPRLGDLFRFFAGISTHDMVAPPHGRRRLADYYAALAPATAVTPLPSLN